MISGKVSVIVLNWNGGGFVVRCLESLLEQTHPDLEVVVVDNGSRDGSLEVIRERFRDLPRLELGENLGYCRANNAAIPYADGEFLLFLNTDVVLEPDFLEHAVASFALDPRIGMVTGKLLRFGGEVVDTTGQFLGRSRRTVERGFDRTDDRRFAEPGPVFSVCGAAALYRRRMVEEIEVGGEFFDEDFFAFHEDLDVGWRAQNSGWRGHYNPQAVGYHFRGGWLQPYRKGRRRRLTLRHAPPDLQFHIVKNRYLSILKNDTAGGYLRDLPFIWGRDLLVLGFLLWRRPGVLWRLFREREVFRRALEKREFLRRMRGGEKERPRERRAGA
ncbi:MAG: glycosyltransferase family 2 protein [Acidobacteria bacterium]|nr:glycosyltransferase family 2 protein [Acidobacteriota bacterium]